LILLASSASIVLAGDHTQGRARNYPGADAEAARVPVVAVLGEALAHHLAEASLAPRVDIALTPPRLPQLKGLAGRDAVGGVAGLQRVGAKTIRRGLGIDLGASRFAEGFAKRAARADA
jgi:hypothetical protein